MTTTTVTALYPNEPGSRFDAGYYRDRHAPFAWALLAPFGLVRIGTSLGIASVDGGPPAFWAVSEMEFESRERFDAAMSARGEQLFADIVNYTSVTPVLQISRPVDPTLP